MEMIKVVPVAFLAAFGSKMPADMKIGDAAMALVSRGKEGVLRAAADEVIMEMAAKSGVGAAAKRVVGKMMFN